MEAGSLVGCRSAESVGCRARATTGFRAGGRRIRLFRNQTYLVTMPFVELLNREDAFVGSRALQRKVHHGSFNRQFAPAISRHCL